ncbi:MAG: MarR family winged helix-turn-helix transcriptional regulator [Oscillospiraceae bacterium]|nr:MarR family winged helix-turn-helix transcriptional regulator [Oscillospiraceae bacterium]
MDRYDEVCSKIRAFNRFYTVQMELLSSGYLGSDYSVTETRVLFEIKNHSGCMQSDIVKTLHVDKSYLSRIIRRFSAKGLVEKIKCDGDKRAEKLALTELGNVETENLIALTNKRINAQISGLDQSECDALSDALDTVISILGKEEH